MRKLIRVMLVDDHEIVRDGITALIQGTSDIQVVAEASDSTNLFNKLKTVKPDILILDIALPDTSGIEITKMVTSNYPEIKIIIFSGTHNDDDVFETLNSGAKGFVTKDSIREDLLEAIYSVYNGKEYLSDTISNTMLIKYISKNKQIINTQEQINLTQREIEVLKLIAEGFRYKEIGEKLFLSARTIETHKNNILQKLDLKTITDLVKYAIKNKLI
ncbi:MAG: hypothetical protein A2275_01110 [Bacteroidetes bacterium RIFOXYA12_FULL_35_11]|nr:MAG: hypothetical protein A2X01_03945 [Bacteroidetes bacterium GWF2_35_48]OFY78417.1 MAG: hypothetical protein A2275_01110 [Bacteroidetes bacterium RIFOXYA12_FULL_35_11]OFY93492.1 MAG: hypothetical protein A2491_10930 [Bacteroidetes bacterium RIFOXYC12_FULL_35_7]HBX50866.1 DNA-binding response regulator [Bacteroidales bacterium]